MILKKIICVIVLACLTCAHAAVSSVLDRLVSHKAEYTIDLDRNKKDEESGVKDVQGWAVLTAQRRPDGVILNQEIMLVVTYQGGLKTTIRRSMAIDDYESGQTRYCNFRTTYRAPGVNQSIKGIAMAPGDLVGSVRFEADQDQSGSDEQDWSSDPDTLNANQSLMPENFDLPKGTLLRGAFLLRLMDIASPDTSESAFSKPVYSPDEEEPFDVQVVSQPTRTKTPAFSVDEKVDENQKKKLAEIQKQIPRAITCLLTPISDGDNTEEEKPMKEITYEILPCGIVLSLSWNEPGVGYVRMTLGRPQQKTGRPSFTLLTH